MCITFQVIAELYIIGIWESIGLWRKQSLIFFCFRCNRPITVVGRSNAWTVVALSKAEVMGSNPSKGIGICVGFFCVSTGSGLATGWSTVQRVLPTVLGLRIWSQTKLFTDALSPKVGARRKRERLGQELNWMISLMVKVLFNLVWR
jgi:hypothetical protein